MNGPASARRPFRPGANRPRAPRKGRGPAESGQRRTLWSVLARQAARVRSHRALLSSAGKALLLTLLAAVAAAPLALVWGISHAQVQDYLGPHRVTFASNFRGEVELNLGPSAMPTWRVRYARLAWSSRWAVSALPPRIPIRFSQSRL